MSVVPSDLVFYGSQSMPEIDGVAPGSGIDLTTRVAFDDAILANTLNRQVAALSSSIVDSGIPLYVTGRNSAGVIVSDTILMSGTFPATGAQTFERILKILTVPHTGTITVREVVGNTGIASLESGVLQIRRPFYDVSADVAGGSTRNYYDKTFLKNNNTTNALLNAYIIESGDPSGKLTFAIASGYADAGGAVNRQTAPSGTTAFNSTTKSLPSGFLNPGDSIGVWLNLTLSAGDAAAKTTYTLQVSGTTT